jgi:hypothetical protein
MKSKEDSAHILAAPPFFFIIPLLIGAVIEYFVPTKIFSTIASIIIGLIFSWASLPFFILSLKSFFKAKTTFDARIHKSLVLRHYICNVILPIYPVDLLVYLPH